jgi:hypothetical protein
MVSAGGLRVVGLTTPRPYLWKGGRVDATQVARIGVAFGHPARLKVLMLHYPVFRSPQRPARRWSAGWGKR